MNWPSVEEFRVSRDSGRYLAMLKLQAELNRQLLAFYEEVQYQDSEYVAKALISKVQELVDQLNATGHKFGHVDYSGDKDFERSEQTFCDGKWNQHSKTHGSGLEIQFSGFTARVRWRDRQKKKGR